MAANPITVRDVLTDVANMVGLKVSNCDNLKAPVRNRLNAALQLIYLSPVGRAYFCQDIVVALVAGTSSYPLNTGVAEVVGPVRLQAQGAPLSPLASRGELDLWGPVYQGAQTLGAVQGTPQAYYVDQQSDLGDAGGDPKTLTLRLTPTPVANENLVVEVRQEPPRFSAADMDANPGPIVPLADAHCELVLLPIVRYEMLTAAEFISDREIALMQPYAQAYQRALVTIGELDAARDVRDRQRSPRTERRAS